MNFLNLILIFLFFLGLSVGSFINALVFRLKTKRKIIHARSICPKCQKKLETWDLIPLLSFIILRGRCRACQQKISWQYPLVELATGIIFVLVFYYQIEKVGSWSWINIFSLFFYLFITFSLITIFVYDLKYLLIPGQIIWPALIFNLAYLLLAFFFYLSKNKEIYYRLYPHLWPSVHPPLYFFYGILLGTGIFLALVLLSKEKWMGAGDIQIGFLMGLLLGFPLTLLALSLAFVLGAFVGIFLVIFKKKSLKSQVPFAPFLITGIFITLFWGDWIINWYLKFLRF